MGTYENCFILDAENILKWEDSSVNWELFIPSF